MRGIPARTQAAPGARLVVRGGHPEDTLAQRERLTDSQLANLPIAALLDVHRKARAVGEHDYAKQALGIFAYRVERKIRGWIRRWVFEASDEVIDDIEAAVLEAVVSTRSIPQGDDERAVLGWLRAVTHNKATDHLRERLPREQREGALVEEHEPDGESYGEHPATESHEEAVAARDLVERALEGLNPSHRRIIELAGEQDLGFEQRPAAQVTEIINQDSSRDSNPMSIANVYKIVSRFNATLDQMARDASEGQPYG